MTMADRTHLRRRSKCAATFLLGLLLAVACSSGPTVEQETSPSQPPGPTAEPVNPPRPTDAASPIDEIAVTATRTSRSGGESRAAPVLPQEQERQRLFSAPAPGLASIGPAQTVRYAQPPGSGLLSQVQPGEELWVIETRSAATAAEDDDEPGSGTMVALVVPGGGQAQPVEVPLPLRHTAVRAVVDGYVSAVDVTQQFENPYDEKIEAVYLFPLPEKAAVNEFVMTIGERRIRGILREKEEAQRIYEDARAQGYRASLLVQHRPNIFEQKVANIEPGKRIDVNIRYFHTLAYSDGWYSFVFPTVVGPRYNPLGSSDPVAALPRTDFGEPPAGTAVRYLRPQERSAHDLRLSVDIDAGVAIEELTASHDVATQRDGESRAHVQLAAGNAMPNRDFILKFRVAGETVKSNLLTYVDPETRQGYFTLFVYPPAAPTALRRQPVEMVFVIDTSGSMSGRPLEQARAAVNAALDRLERSDKFQIMNFSSSVRQFAAAPVPATSAPNSVTAYVPVGVPLESH
jgi:Ca-activated chloride channel family protein